MDGGTLMEHFKIQTAMTFSVIMSVLARESIQFALLDEKQISQEKGHNRITMMTDARHQCRKKKQFSY